jgi:hypothetical protein
VRKVGKVKKKHLIFSLCENSEILLPKILFAPFEWWNKTKNGYQSGIKVKLMTLWVEISIL